MTVAKQRIVVFISGGGSNMLRLIETCADASFPGVVVGVLSDRADAGGVPKASAAGIETCVLERKSFGSRHEHEAAILAWLKDIEPDWICLAGYMRLLSADFINAYEGRIINIHPSLLPLFPGLHTHQRAIDAGMKIAGCTVHHVTEGMDEGAIIGQAAVPILDNDTDTTLAARVLAAEHQLYPAVLEYLITGGVGISDQEQPKKSRLFSIG